VEKKKREGERWEQGAGAERQGGGAGDEEGDERGSDMQRQMQRQKCIDALRKDGRGRSRVSDSEGFLATG
jgi:hypothetical protein